MMGLEIERSLPGGVRSRWERDRLGRPLRHTVTGKGSLSGGSGGKTRTRSYTWDPGYRLRQIEDSELGTTVFKHDPVGNLEGAVYGDFSAVFRSPDAIGNLFKDRSRTDRKYGPAGQLLESRSAQGVTTYEYDPEGNLIRKVAPGDKVWSYEWNAGGMLARVIRPDGEAVEFKYDPLGRRIAKTYNGKTTRWVWYGNVPLHEWVEDACVDGGSEAKSVPNANADVIQAGHQARIAPISAQGPPADQNSQSSILNSQLTTWLFEPESFAPMAKIVDGQSYSIVTDHLGTPFEMYDAAGLRTWAAELDVYGAVRVVQEGAAIDCPFRYPGQYEDEETGLYYNRFRYYDPEAGGYVSQDPIGLAGGNRTIYGYVNDPFIQCDELGLNCGKSPSTTAKLQKHADDAKAKAKLSPKQKASIERSNQRALKATDPKVKAHHEMMAAKKEQMYMGTQVDTEFKKLVDADPSLKHVSTTPRGKFGPDVYSNDGKNYWDLTTKKDWDKGTHQAKYDADFGKGTGIFW